MILRLMLSTSTSTTNLVTSPSIFAATNEQKVVQMGSYTHYPKTLYDLWVCNTYKDMSMGSKINCNAVIEKSKSVVKFCSKSTFMLGDIPCQPKHIHMWHKEFKINLTTNKDVISEDIKNDFIVFTDASNISNFKLANESPTADPGSLVMSQHTIKPLPSSLVDWGASACNNNKLDVKTLHGELDKKKSNLVNMDLLSVKSNVVQPSLSLDKLKHSNGL